MAPTELEEILVSHPSVHEAGVAARWDESQATELPVGYVTLTEEAQGRANKKALAQEIQHHVDSRVSGYKRLRGGLVFLETMPKTSSGKVLRRLLSESRRIPILDTKL